MMNIPKAEAPASKVVRTKAVFMVKLVVKVTVVKK
jgi:hypothetical protein